MALFDSDLTGPVNIGNPDEYTVLELAHTVVELLGSSSPIVHRPLPVDDPTRRRPDISMARAALGWEPTTALGTACCSPRHTWPRTPACKPPQADRSSAGQP